MGLTSVRHLETVGTRKIYLAMLSNASLRAGSFGPILVRSLAKNNGLPAVRCMSGTPLEKHLENWDKANKIYYGPERDTVNFPILTQPDTTPPVRMAIIPESWFQFFYEKTGVTGPYMFGGGLITFLLSKELWVIEHGFTEFIAFWLAVAYLKKKIGPGIAENLDKLGEEYRAKHWEKPIAEVKGQCEETIKAGETAIWQESGQAIMFEAKKENVDLQLEAIYRKRLADVHHAVKKRLDYQLEVENTQRRFEQNHMVNWIVDSVVKGITPQQEKDSIAKCIADLKGLAAK